MKLLTGLMAITIAVLVWQGYELRTEAVTGSELADTFRARDIEAARVERNRAEIDRFNRRSDLELERQQNWMR